MSFIEHEDMYGIVDASVRAQIVDRISTSISLDPPLPHLLEQQSVDQDRRLKAQYRLRTEQEIRHHLRAVSAQIGLDYADNSELYLADIEDMSSGLPRVFFL